LKQPSASASRTEISYETDESLFVRVTVLVTGELAPVLSVKHLFVRITLLVTGELAPVLSQHHDVKMYGGVEV
jgi:hypothetical protein